MFPAFQGFPYYTQQFKDEVKLPCKIWLKNEGLPTEESVFGSWFCQEGRMDKSDIIEHLNTLGEHMYTVLQMTEAFTASVMIFIEQFRARWPWSISVLES